jgi:hypothetical protein
VVPALWEPSLTDAARPLLGFKRFCNVFREAIEDQKL